MLDAGGRRLAPGGEQERSDAAGIRCAAEVFELEGRLPRHAGEPPPAAVAYLAQQVRVDPGEFATGYGFSGRTAEYHRAQVRTALGFREAGRADEERLTAWLADEVCPGEPDDDRQRDALLRRCRAERIEPPGRLGRILGAARRLADERFCETTVAQLSSATIAKLEELVGGDDPAAPAAGDEHDRRAVGGGPGLLAELKADPGRLGLETLLAEIAKLERVRAPGLPVDLFADASEKRLRAWRARAGAEYPAWLRAHPAPVRLTLLAVLCACRQTEITDSLMELFLGVVHRVNARAENRVEGELIADLKRVRGKEGILFSLAHAAVEHPDETVRRALYPVVGESTLRDLVREAKTNEAAFRARVRTVLRSSYSNHYRRMLPRLLAALDLRCNNSAYRPVMDAVVLLRRYADRDRVQLSFRTSGGRYLPPGVSA